MAHLKVKLTPKRDTDGKFYAIGSPFYILQAIGGIAATPTEDNLAYAIEVNRIRKQRDDLLAAIRSVEYAVSGDDATRALGKLYWLATEVRGNP